MIQDGFVRLSLANEAAIPPHAPFSVNGVKRSAIWVMESYSYIGPATNVSAEYCDCPMGRQDAVSWRLKEQEHSGGTVRINFRMGKVVWVPARDPILERARQILQIAELKVPHRATHHILLRPTLNPPTFPTTTSDVR